MSSWAKITSRWFQRLVKGKEPEPARQAGTLAIVSGAEAVLATETMVSERIGRALSAGETRPTTERGAGKNAFGRETRELIADDDRSALAAAEGLSPERASAFCWFRRDS